MLCPSETVLSEFLAGRLPEARRAQVLVHLEACESCQQVLALGSSSLEGLSGSSPTPAPEKAVAPGSLLSRYVVHERLGAGAMGVVYAAHDPELDRRVAIKLLRAEGRHIEELRLRLVREAQALARLSHPNVVTVHDVGTCDSGVFLAMELVEGTTLAEWLRQPRPWREVLDVFLKAGRGLAAAHSAGLVHRDFKPANVLVGRDGQVRVTDFGLASTSGTPELLSPAPAPQSGAPVEHTASLTRTGAVLGTPAYMAPEQLRGSASAQSDQFSFCVALYEALYGQRPFQGQSAEDIARAALEGQVVPLTRGPKLPTWVTRAVLRGLEGQPQERFDSMEALLTALSPRPLRTRVWVGAAALLASVLGIGVGYRAAHRHEVFCAQEAQKLAGAWSPEHGTRARTAFLATGLSTAAPIWDKVAAMLDDYTGRWSTLRTEACIAAAGDTASPSWQTVSCLDTRLVQLAAVTDALGKADAQTVRNAPQMMASLEGLGGCRDAPSLSMRPQPPDALRPQVDALRRQLAEARALGEVGKHAEGLVITTALLEKLPELPFRPLEAEMLVSHGFFLSLTGHSQEGEKVLQRAVLAAEAGRDDEAVAHAWVQLLRVQGLVLGRVEDATRSAQHARAVLERLGREHNLDITTEFHNRLGDLELLQLHLEAAEAEFSQALELARKNREADDPRIGMYLQKLGNVRFEQQRYEEALTLYLQANSVWEVSWGPDDRSIALNLANVASARMMLGRIDEAIAAYRRSLTLLGIYYSADHPLLVAPHSGMGTLLAGLGRMDEAREHFQKALDISERAQGRNHPDVVLLLTGLGGVAADSQRLDEALAYQRDALARLELSVGPDSSNSALPLEYLGRTQLQAGRPDEARRHFQQALEVLEKHHGPDDVSQTGARRGLARVELALRKPQPALVQCQRALELDERVQGAQVPDVAMDLACLGEAHLMLGAPARALPLLERSRDILQRSSLDRKDEAWSYFLLARALWEQDEPSHPARALSLAEEARALLRPQQPRGQAEWRQVSEWLAQRQPVSSRNLP